MKRHDLFLAIALILVGGFITVLVANQRMDILPKPELEGGERGMLGIDKNINEETIDNYLGRKDAVYRDIQFGGFYEYQEETLRRLFYEGHPCAIRTVIKGGEQDRWLPVMYLDDDGGVIWNPYSKERFLAELYQIREICCFNILSDEDILRSLF